MNEFLNRNEILSPGLLERSAKQAEILKEQYSPSMKVFIDHYGMDVVKSDLRAVLIEEEKHRFDNQDNPLTIERKRISDIFEYFFIDAVTKNNWLGKSELMRSTKYDDYFNGVDILGTLLQENNNAQHLEIGTDLTYGSNASNKKLERIVSGIENQHLGQIKYFHSDHLGFTGRIKDIPRTVIGLDKNNLGEFVRNHLYERDTESSKMVLMQQLLMQLRGFRDYADKLHGESLIRRRYTSAHAQIEGILKANDVHQDDIPEDEITSNIKHVMHSLTH